MRAAQQMIGCSGTDLMADAALPEAASSCSLLTAECAMLVRQWGIGRRAMCMLKSFCCCLLSGSLPKLPAALLTWPESPLVLSTVVRGTQFDAAGCPTKQTNIVHSSLMRILTPEQLSPATRQAIQRKCQDWTKQLHGTQLHLPEAWWDAHHIRDYVIFTIAGHAGMPPLHICFSGA